MNTQTDTPNTHPRKGRHRKYGFVTVVRQEGSLAQIRPQNGDEMDEFWVKADSVRELKERRRTL